MVILGGGGEGVRVRSGDFDLPRPSLAAVSEEGLTGSSLDIVVMLCSPSLSALTRSDPVVLSSGAVPEEIGISIGRMSASC